MARSPALGFQGALLGVIGGFVVTGFEAFQFHTETGASLVSHDALIGFFVAGPSLLALARLWNRGSARPLAKAGRLTLGVYACHTLVAAVVLEGVRRVEPSFPHPILREGGSFILIATASFALAWVLSLIPATRRLVQ